MKHCRFKGEITPAGLKNTAEILGRWSPCGLRVSLLGTSFLREVFPTALVGAEIENPLFILKPNCQPGIHVHPAYRITNHLAARIAHLLRSRLRPLPGLAEKHAEETPHEPEGGDDQKCSQKECKHRLGLVGLTCPTSGAHGFSAPVALSEGSRDWT